MINFGELWNYFLKITNKRDRSGNSRRCQSDPTKALALFDAALEIYRNIGDQYSQARILVVSMADAYSQLQQPEQAMQCLQQARQLWVAIDFTQGVDYIDAKLQALQNPVVNRLTSYFARLNRQPFWFWFVGGVAIALLIW